MTFKGKYHHLENVGIHHLPVQQPIPIWFGGFANATLRCVAQIGDGWLAYNVSLETAKTKISLLHDYLKEVRRTPEDISIGCCLVEPRADKDFVVDKYVKYVQDWRDAGATHCDIEFFSGIEKPIQAHLEALKRFKEEVIAAV